MNITILMPVWNRAATLRRAIESTAGQGADQFVIIDDHSTDGSYEIASEYPGITVHRHAAKSTDHLRALEPIVESLQTDYVLGIGADDYLSKPCFTSELVFRINNSLKRQKPTEKKLISFGPLQLDPDFRTFYLDGKDLNLTEFEFEILSALVSNSGKPLDRKSIYQHVAGYEFEFNSRNMDVKVAHLRKKLGKWHGMIRTVWGVGYEIVIPDTI